MCDTSAVHLCIAYEVRVNPDPGEVIAARDGEQLKYRILHVRVVVLARRGSRMRLLFFLPDKEVPCGSPPPIISKTEYGDRSVQGPTDVVRKVYGLSLL